MWCNYFALPLISPSCHNMLSPSIFSSVCVRNETCYGALSVSLETDQTMQPAHTAEIWGVAKLHSCLPWDSSEIFLAHHVSFLCAPRSVRSIWHHHPQMSSSYRMCVRKRTPVSVLHSASLGYGVTASTVQLLQSESCRLGILLSQIHLLHE